MHKIRAGLFCFGLSLLILWESLRLGLGTLEEPGSGFLSFCAGVILSALSLLLIQRSWGVRESKKHPPRHVLLALISLFAYSLVLNTLGFIIATFFFVGILFHLGQSRPWWIQLGMSALVTFLAYLVFGILLHVYFPRGFFGI